MKRYILMTGVGALVLAAGHTSWASAAETKPQHHATPGAPNVLVIVTDDQTAGTVTPGVMPRTYRWFVRQGRSYPIFFAADPLCCPSRASIMTGRFDHNNGVKDNSSDPRAFHLDMRSTVQCHLHRHGYNTALYGKFFNGWSYTTTPPCLDDYTVTRGGRHYNLPFLSNGKMVHPGGWLDAYITRRAVDHIRKCVTHAGPWYAYVSLTAPHSPYQPRPRYAAVPVPSPAMSASVDQPDMSSLAPAVRRHASQRRYELHKWNAEERMLMSVDHEVGALFSTLERTGQLQNTIVFFVSDNGYLFGEHHLDGKRLPYTEAMQVPFYIHAPARVTAGSVDDRLTENVDITPTILAATGSLARTSGIRSMGMTCCGRPGGVRMRWGRAGRSGRRRTGSRDGGRSGQPRINMSSTRRLRTRGGSSGGSTTTCAATPPSFITCSATAIRRNYPDVGSLHAALTGAWRCDGRACP